MSSKEEKFLSIISPYYNREHIINRLYNDLKSYDKADVELLFIDDGSSDNTYEALHIFKDYKHASVKIFRQENKGPGGARNLGYKNATGKYVWFVDSDDKITADAYVYIKSQDYKAFDFINFNLIRYNDQVFNFTGLAEGDYSVNEDIRLQLINNFGALYTKIFRKSFLEGINFSYPENCVNEDYYLYFILPFHFKNFIKTDVVNYLYHDDTESVTRHKAFNNRLYGRQLSAYNGFIEARKYVTNQQQVDALFHKYEKIFYFSALYIFYARNLDGLKRLYVLKKILESEHKHLQELYQPFTLKRTKFDFKGKLKIINKIIDLVPNKTLDISYIEKIHHGAWENPITFPFK